MARGQLPPCPSPSTPKNIPISLIATIIINGFDTFLLNPAPQYKSFQLELFLSRSRLYKPLRQRLNRCNA